MKGGEMKSPREVIERVYDEGYEDNGSHVIDLALSDLAEIVRGMKRVNRNCS